MNEYLTASIAWISQHPHWAGIVVFLINLAESLVVVGLFVPGTVVMFGIGALIAVGAMDLWTTLAWAILGAMVGDGISYLIGRHYREYLRVMWPFNSHPEWLERAERFFVRHGAKSVFFGRFAGPVRPIIPAVAGMMGMPAGLFYWANFLSAITWAPAYILPGVALGTSLTLASQVATRLTIILVLLLLVSWITIVAVRRIYIFFQPRAQLMVLRLLAWGRAHPLFQDVTVGLLDPTHPELKGLIELGIILLLGGWIFFAVLAGELGYSQPLRLDYQIYYLFQGLRTPWADQVMVFLSELVEMPVNLAVAGSGFFWLIFRRQWLAMSHWAIAMAIAVLIGESLHYLLPIATPRAELNLGAINSAFPSIHAVVVSTLYGFLAVLIARELPPALRRLPYIGIAVWIILIMVADLYLGSHWLSDIVGGIALGVIWLSFVGIAYRSRAASSLDLRGLVVVLLLALLLAGGGYVFTQHESQVNQYAVRYPERALDMGRWWYQDWQTLASYRVDWGGDSATPMTMQVAGNLSDLRQYFEQHGWHEPTPLNAASILRLLTPNPELNDLPVLPNSHNGHRDALRLIQSHTTADGISVRLVLRLWRANAHLMPEGIPLWVGNVTRQQVIEHLGLVTLPKTEFDYDAPLVLLRESLVGLPWREVKRDGPYPVGWKGTVLLLKATDYLAPSSTLLPKGEERKPGPVFF